MLAYPCVGGKSLSRAQITRPPRRALWDARERIVFYGSALLIVGAVGAYFWEGLPGYDALAFIGVIACAGYAMIRVWRDRHTYT